MTDYTTTDLPLTAAHAAALTALADARAAELAATEAWRADDCDADDLTAPARVAMDAAEDRVDECERAEAEARRALYLSEEPCEYTLRDGQCGVEETIVATSDADARRQAEEWARDGYTHDGGEMGDRGTWWVDVYVIDLLGQRECVTVRIDPEAPECAEGQDHEWCSPIEVVGGIAENPGVWGHGGGVRIKEVCRHCGCYRDTDTWAQRMDTGEQGLASVEYRDADDESIAWVESQREDAEKSA